MQGSLLTAQRMRQRNISENNPESGFVALMTAIVLVVILLVVAISLNLIGFLTRGEILDSEYKDRSSALAEACADTTLLKLAKDSAYAGNEANVSVGSDKCNIGLIQNDTPIARQKTINVDAVFPPSSVTNQNAVTKLQIIINSITLSVISWNEIP